VFLMTPVTVVLVHGTFDRAALWAQPGSVFRTSLSRTLPNAEIVVHFWSGSNSFSARAAAATDLARLLRSTSALNSSARILIVAHSHGGNIALQAIGDANIGDQCSGVACLATPFLQFLPRDIGDAALLSVGAIGAALLLGLYAWVFYKLLLPRFSPAAVDHYIGTIALIVAFGLLSLYVVACQRMWQHWQTRAMSLVHPATAVATDKVLLIRATADEAAAVLGAASAIGVLATKIWRSLQRLANRIADIALHSPMKTLAAALQRMMGARDRLLAPIHRRAPWLPDGCAPLAIFTIWTLVIAGIPNVFWTLSGNVETCLILIAFLPPVVFVLGAVLAALWEALYWLELALYLMLSIVRLPIITLLALVQWATVDRETALITLLVDIYADATPPGVWTVHLLPISNDPGVMGQNRKLYRHTRICFDPRAIELVCKWAVERTQLMH
jgi:hypothetical protein